MKGLNGVVTSESTTYIKVLVFEEQNVSFFLEPYVFQQNKKCLIDSFLWIWMLDLIINLVYSNIITVTSNIFMWLMFSAF